ncbi:MAG: biopolymer transporter ExbD [Bdellovibrionales bacterium]|jgi:biopolymer transport protein ExbD|nr:biopolymer transporter ExbD [Bdellovibrionales bacterium]MBL7670548.1 biopolymer transporter ExbD [Pseudobdellovibrionaceae bacterium]
MASLNDDTEIISSINITPFVDVVLVLLVVFMVTAPLMMKDILEIRLPKVSHGDGGALQTLGVAVNREGQILVNGVLTDEAGLQEAAQGALSQNVDSQAIISADEAVVYGRVVRVIDLLKGAGLNRFAVQITTQ